MSLSLLRRRPLHRLVLFTSLRSISTAPARLSAPPAGFSRDDEPGGGGLLSYFYLGPRINRFLRVSGAIHDADLRRMISRGGALAGYAAIGAGLAGSLGIDTSPIVAGLSVTGLTVGFASRDVASNYIAGLMLIVTKPFKSGERINIGKVSDNVGGLVVKIDMRYTYIQPVGKDEEDQVLLVPNATIWNSVVVAHDKSIHMDATHPSDDNRSPTDRMRSVLGWDCNSKDAADTATQPLPPPPQIEAPPHTEEEAAAKTALPADSDVVRALRHVAESRLSALQEHVQGRRLAPHLQGLSHFERKVLLWLASDPEGAKATPEWAAFVRASDGVPSWVPSDLAGRAKPESAL